jgi:methyltransferase family protein
MKRSKLLNLLAILPRHPREFSQRVVTSVQVRLEPYCRRPPRHEPLGWDVAVQGLSRSLSVDIYDYLTESPLRDIEDEIATNIQSLPANAPFALSHNGDFSLARLCYLLARVSRPENVLETGVCYGVTSAFLLKALEVNGRGRLHSIDLPPLDKNADPFVGSLIPASLKENWTLYRGTSKNLLPLVLRSAGGIGLFVHDSLHTYRNMRRELEMVTPYLVPPAAVVADDVDGNGAFQQWVSHVRPHYWAAVREQSKPGLLGLAILQEGRGNPAKISAESRSSAQ